MNEFKTFAAVVSFMVLCTVGAFAWTSPLLTPADSTLGDNMKISKTKAVLEEIRTTVDANHAIFSTFTAAIRTSTANNVTNAADVAAITARYESYSTAHGL